MTTDPSTLNIITSQVRNKVDDLLLLALQSNTAAPRVLMSTEVPTTNILSLSLLIHLGRVVTNAFTAGVNFRIEGSTAPSGDGFWFPITVFTSALGTNIGSQNVGAAGAAAGQKVIPIAATANFVVGDIVYIQNATHSQGEFGRINTVSANTSITLEDNLRFSQPATSLVTSKSEMFYGLIDTSALERLRIVIDGSGAGQNFDVELLAVAGS